MERSKSGVHGMQTALAKMQLNTICESNYWFYCFAVLFVQFSFGVDTLVRRKTANAEVVNVAKVQDQT